MVLIKIKVMVALFLLCEFYSLFSMDPSPKPLVICALKKPADRRFDKRVDNTSGNRSEPAITFLPGEQIEEIVTLDNDCFFYNRQKIKEPQSDTSCSWCFTSWCPAFCFCRCRDRQVASVDAIDSDEHEPRVQIITPDERLPKNSAKDSKKHSGLE